LSAYAKAMAKMINGVVIRATASATSIDIDVFLYDCDLLLDRVA
jgi:hypothetical protein